MFELNGVAKSYGGRQVLSPCDLVLAPKRTTVLIGPSGSGKSTLIRLMVGLIVPDEGTIRFDGGALSPANVREKRLRMGYVIQEGGLFPHLRARDNVTLMARHLGWNEERIRARVESLATLAQLPGDALDRFPAELSGGQRQRVSLMRALMLDADVLLLDEPLGALDPMIRFELQNDLKGIFAALGKTVAMVTHDMSEAAFFADRIVLLRDGRIVQEGTLADLLDRPADDFVKRFVQAQRAPSELLGGGRA
jgi:osmoprotectant transport system ATP-binding protein